MLWQVDVIDDGVCHHLAGVRNGRRRGSAHHHCMGLHTFRAADLHKHKHTEYAALTTWCAF
jgi:hypothetical protein